MSVNLPQKRRRNLFSKLLDDIRIFFTKNKKETENMISDYKGFKSTGKEYQKNKIMENLKVNVDTSNIYKEHEKKEFMQRLNNNPELLDNFSIERLEKILQYYLDENKKKRELLKKINYSTNN